MTYNVARVRRLVTKFQVDICKTKIDTSAHAQLRTLQLRSKTWFIMWQESGGYLQNFKSIHAKVKKTDLPCAVPHLVVEIQAMIYNAARVRRLFTKFQVNTCKTKKKDRSAHAQLHQAMTYNAASVRRLSTKLQVVTCKSKEDRSAMRSCAPCSWDPSHDL